MSVAEAADVTLNALTIDGQSMTSDVAQAVTEAQLERTIDGAPTLTITLALGDGGLLRSGIFSKRITAQFDGKGYELAQVRKSETTIDLTFEDIVVAELRRHDTPRKVEAGTMTRIEFAKLLLQETPWIRLSFNSDEVRPIKAKVELARGRIATEDQEEEKEDTWTCLKRIFSEVQWNCYVDYENPTGQPAIQVGPDRAYIDKGTVITLTENAEGVNRITFDYDIGKPIASLSAEVRVHRWQVPPGTPMKVEGQGPADGVYICSSVSGSIFSHTRELQLKSPVPELPEPDPPEDPSGDLGTDVEEGERTARKGSKVGGSAVSASGFRWPTMGTVSSGFGKRGKKMHEGIDIAASTGTPVGASKGGTVTFAGSQGGYGNVVYVSHGGVEETRYAHLSRILCRRGQVLSAGQQLGEVGATGNAKGAHLHFEVRRNGKAQNPTKYLPGSSK